MYRIVLCLIGCISILVTGAQVKFQGSLIPGPSPNSVDIVISPTADFTGYLSSVIFTFQIPEAIVAQPTIIKTPLSSYFPGEFEALTPDSSGGFVNYVFSAANVAVTTDTLIHSGDSYGVLRLSFSGGPANPLTDVRLASLPNGGPGSKFQFYIEANSSSAGVEDLTNYPKMFVGAGASPATPFADNTTGYANYQYVSVSTVLPLKLTGFNAVTKDRNTILTWVTQNQDGVASHFEIERSLNGVNFTYLDKVAASEVNNGPGVYKYIDENVSSVKSRGLIFYRIRSVDKDGKAIYSEVRSIRINSNGFEVGLYPSPSKTHTIATINLEEALPIVINISDAAGKQVKNFQMAGVKGVNVRRIDLSALASGSYLVKVSSGAQLQTVSLLKQ